MSMNVLMIILSVMIILLIMTWIPFRSIFEHFYGNNPLKAKIYVAVGENEDICKGKYDHDSNHGWVYRYKWHGVYSTVVVPRSYPYVYVLGCRKIRVMAGHATCAPLGGMPSEYWSLSGSQLDDVLRAHIGKDLANTIFGKAVNYMMILIVIGVALFGAYFLLKQSGVIGGPSVPVQPDTPSQTVPTGINNDRPLE